MAPRRAAVTPPPAPPPDTHGEAYTLAAPVYPRGETLCATLGFCPREDCGDPQCAACRSDYGAPPDDDTP